MTMNTDTTTWADSRETHPTVAAAIFALANGDTTIAEAIWSDPTATQLALIIDFVASEIRRGNCDREPSGRYWWGCDSVAVTEDDVDASAR